MIYTIVIFIVRVYYKIFFKVECRGLENVPKEGAAIICSNHISNYDPLSIAAVLDRLPSFLAKKELFANKFFTWFLTSVDAIPVDRGKADMNSFRTVMSRLKEGHLVCIFAHGHRTKDAEAKDAKAGTALFAVKSGVSVIPTSIITEYKLFQKVIISFGAPIDFSEYKGKRVGSEELNEIATGIMEKVEAQSAEVKGA